MKKTLLILLALVMVALTACTQNVSTKGTLIGQGQTIESDASYVVKRLPTYGSDAVMLRAVVDLQTQKEYAADGNTPKDDPLLEIVAQFYSAAYTFDYERLFTLFASEHVDAELDKFRSKHGELASLDRAELTAGMSELSEYYKCGNVEISYTVTGVKDITDGFADNYAGMDSVDASKITKAVQYTFADTSAVFFDKFDFDPDFTDMVFYRYNDQWYLIPSYLHAMVDMYDGIDYVKAEETIIGTVTEVGDGYAIVDGTLLLTDSQELTLNDTIEARVYADAHPIVSLKDSGGGIPMRTLISAKPAEN